MCLKEFALVPKNSETMVWLKIEMSLLDDRFINRRVVCVRIVRANRLNCQVYINQSRECCNVLILTIISKKD